MRIELTQRMGRWGQAVALCGTAVFAGLFHAPAVNASQFKVLYSFCAQANCADGADASGLVEDQHRNLYGTTLEGGAYGKGAVFELKRRGKDQYEYIVLYSFCQAGGYCPDGWSPQGPLILDTAGNLYGLTYFGGGNGVGEAFELAKGGHAWSLGVLYSFCSQSNCADGEDAIAGLTYDGAATGQPYDGSSPLYGVTYEGGANSTGVAFALQSGANGWQEQVLYSFCSLPYCADGGLPSNTLVEDGSGNLYGTTLMGSNNDGNIFELSPDGSGWTETTLYNFCSENDCADGSRTSSGLTLNPTGDLYGETWDGGNSCSQQNLGCGVVFRVAPNGIDSQESVVHAFCAQGCTDGYSPGGGVALDAKGDVFGTAEYGGDFEYVPDGGGTIFELRKKKQLVLYQFCQYTGCTDGSEPFGLIRDAAGRLFGTTASGGTYGEGVVFELMP